MAMPRLLLVGSTASTALGILSAVGASILFFWTVSASNGSIACAVVPRLRILSSVVPPKPIAPAIAPPPIPPAFAPSKAAASESSSEPPFRAVPSAPPIAPALAPPEIPLARFEPRALPTALPPYLLATLLSPAAPAEPAKPLAPPTAAFFRAFSRLKLPPSRPALLYSSPIPEIAPPPTLATTPPTPGITPSTESIVFSAWPLAVFVLTLVTSPYFPVSR